LSIANVSLIVKYASHVSLAKLHVFISAQTAQNAMNAGK